jgi:hypothetical protein
MAVVVEDAALQVKDARPPPPRVFIGLARPAAALTLTLHALPLNSYQNSKPRVHVKCSAVQTDSGSSIRYSATKPQTAMGEPPSHATTALKSGRRSPLVYT